MQIDDEDDSTEEEDDGDERVATFEGGYNPADFENLPVSADIKELFQYIGRYTPQQVIDQFRFQGKIAMLKYLINYFLI